MIQLFRYFTSRVFVVEMLAIESCRHTFHLDGSDQMIVMNVVVVVVMLISIMAFRFVNHSLEQFLQFFPWRKNAGWTYQRMDGQTL